MKLELFGSNIHVRRLPPENSVYQKTFLILPDEKEFDSFECAVLGVGPGELLEDGSREPLDIVPGQIVIVPQGHGDGTSLEDGSFIVDISAVEAIVEDSEVLQTTT